MVFKLLHKLFLFSDSFETPGYSFNHHPEFHGLGMKVLQSHLLHLLDDMWKGSSDFKEKAFSLLFVTDCLENQFQRTPDVFGLGLDSFLKPSRSCNSFLSPVPCIEVRVYVSMGH